NEAHGFAIAGGHLDVPAEVLLEAISQRDSALHRGRSEDRASKDLRDRADAENCLAIRDRARSRGSRTEAPNGAFAISHGADHETRHLVLQKGYLAGELQRLLEQRLPPP